MVRNITQKVIVKIGDTIKKPKKGRSKKKVTKKQPISNIPRGGGYFPFGVIQTGPGISEREIMRQHLPVPDKQLYLPSGSMGQPHNLLEFKKPDIQNTINFYDNLIARANAQYAIEKLERLRNKGNGPTVEDVSDDVKRETVEPDVTSYDDTTENMTITGTEPDVMPSSLLLQPTSSVLSSDIKDTVTLPPTNITTVDLETIIQKGFEKSAKEPESSIDLTKETGASSSISDIQKSSSDIYNDFNEYIISKATDKDIAKDVLNKMYDKKGVRTNFKNWFSNKYDINIQTSDSKEITKRMKTKIKEIGYDKFIADLTIWNGKKWNTK